MVDTLVLSQSTGSSCLLGTIHWGAVVKGRVEVGECVCVCVCVCGHKRYTVKG